MTYKELENKILTNLIYRGKDIFTLVFSDENPDVKNIGFNIVSCIFLEHQNFAKLKVSSVELRKLDMQGVFLVQKQELNIEDYYCVVIKGVDSKTKEYEIVAYCKELIIDNNIDLFNPISADKYPKQPTESELKNLTIEELQQKYGQ